MFSVTWCMVTHRSGAGRTSSSMIRAHLVTLRCWTAVDLASSLRALVVSLSQPFRLSDWSC